MGCTVRRNQYGNLALNVIWDGRRSWEGTGLADEPENRRRLEKIAALITAEIEAGVFSGERYLHFFPNGHMANEFRVVASAAKWNPTIREYYERWIASQIPPLVRKARRRDYEQHFRCYILDAVVKVGESERVFGEVTVTEVEATPRILVDFRTQLLARGLSVKTVRNILDGSLRAMLREAREVDHLIPTDPLATLHWDRKKRPPVDPFSEEERDRILNWFMQNYPFFFPFIYTLFHTGMRPSEATALRVSDFNVERSVLQISRSRYLGREEATKTDASDRSISLVSGVAEVLRSVVGNGEVAEDYLFVNTESRPIQQGDWSKTYWRKGLAGAGVRYRDFYSTRRTFISTALTRGVNIKFLAEYCGTSVAMIEKSYGRFLRHRIREQLGILEGRDTVQGLQESETLVKPSAPLPENPPKSGMVPTGIEPVFPT